MSQLKRAKKMGRMVKWQKVQINAQMQRLLRLFGWIGVEAREHLGHQPVDCRVVGGIQHEAAVQVRLQVLPGATSANNF